MILAQLMSQTEQWNWVMLAYGFTYAALITYVVSVALRITRSRKKLGERS